MKITVAIPTVAGRERYLAGTLATCTSQPDTELEILVSDNSPGSAEAVVRAAGDARVRYVRPPQFLTMAAHWDFVLENVSGDAVTIIGDDDGLMPGSIAAVSGIYRQHGNVPIHHSLCNYFWPDHPRVEKRNTVDFLHDSRPDWHWEDSEAFLRDAAAGRRRYVDGPMIYHNFVPMPLVRKIADGGAFFRRAIPDVYSALAFAANCPRFYSTGQFLTIAGQGARSNGALVHSGSSDGSTFLAAAMPAWHQPRTTSRTVALLLVDALLEVAERFDRPDLAASIDYPRHLEDVIFETMGMKGNESRRRELGEVWRFARANGASLALVDGLARRTGAKAARMLGLVGPRPGTIKEGRSPTLRLDANVVDIAGAARAVAQHVAALSPAA